MQMTRLGKNGPEVSALGLGCMGMSGMYGPADEKESIATIHAALDAGINLIDTGDFYGMGHNEMLLQKALTGQPRDRYFICVKFGAMRAPNGALIGIDTRPVASSATIRRAVGVHPIAALQIEYSLISRGIETEILPTVRELGISVTAYGVYSRGLLTGSVPSKESTARGDIRGHFPRFQGENLAKNQEMISKLQTIARQKDVGVAQLALGWILSKGNEIIPLVGARTRVQLNEALETLELSFSSSDVRALESAIPPESVAGERYALEQMRTLDSERKASISRGS
jgi:aryl-alcohol dehydrogenase-like predicted oxidoreductase